jgi:hypothetical protein
MMFHMQNLGRLKKLDEEASDAMTAFWASAIAAAAIRAGGAITHATHLFNPE